MSLYNEWKQVAYEEDDQAAATEFWKNYCNLEKGIYESVLGAKEERIVGKFGELASRYEVEPKFFMGFLDGINTSLDNQLDLENFSGDSDIDATISFEKLYFNMLDAKADWLYTLEQWDNILPIERRKEIKKEYNATKTVVKDDKIGRNDPCTCGSGKKYKKCCGNN